MICETKCFGEYCICIHCQRKSDGTERVCLLSEPVKCSKPRVKMDQGCGTELENLIKLIIPKSCKCSGCREYAFEMNSRGVEWCKENRETIIAQVRKSYKKLSNAEKISAVARAVKNGLFLNPLDPPASLVDMAIERASKEGRGDHRSSGHLAAP